MIRAFSLAAAAALSVAGPALPQDQPTPAERAHDAREGVMHNFAFNLGPLGSMARGDTEYDAEQAAMLAGNIATIAQLDLTPYWVEGSSSAELEDSRALPAIWENLEDMESHRQQLVDAAQALQDAAPQGHEAFTAAFRSLGQACGSCHEDYRESDE